MTAIVLLDMLLINKALSWLFNYVFLGMNY
jgi:hypothetical protein